MNLGPARREPKSKDETLLKMVRTVYSRLKKRGSVGLEYVAIRNRFWHPDIIEEEIDEFVGAHVEEGDFIAVRRLGNIRGEVRLFAPIHFRPRENEVLLTTKKAFCDYLWKSPEMRARELVFRAIEHAGIAGATTTQIIRRCPSLHNQQVHDALEGLMDMFCIKAASRPTLTKPATVYIAIANYWELDRKVGDDEEPEEKPNPLGEHNTRNLMLGMGKCRD